ncbi:endothelial differentiation-related factor 1-like isoform X2 [Portunus trituberculatus]|uniref:endothelial differentiation-related factor 1-like isoform X2 n=1 Tax=Portunus trituberculatus TaxID=210409 RepID=UPI001E1CE8EE|nr:endothelial differentiation-related factor 1-like isoform X2 [Portunus trituberculatus]
MSESDWDTVTVLRKKPQKSSQLKSEQAVNQARRSGLQVETSSKWAATNKQHGTSLNTAKLDRETEELKHEKVTVDVGRLIQKGRQSKGWTQKDLATGCVCEAKTRASHYSHPGARRSKSEPASSGSMCWIQEAVLQLGRPGTYSLQTLSCP